MIAQVCGKGGGYPRCQIDGCHGGGCASIHDVEIWVSGWGELEGGKVTRSQLPVGCRIDDLDDPRPQLPVGCRIDDLDDPRARRSTMCLGWAKLGCLGWLKLGVSAVCSYSKTARNGGCVVVFSGGCIDLPFRRQRCDVRVRYSPF